VTEGGSETLIFLCNQSINIRLFDDTIITTDINAIAIYIADLERSTAKYLVCPADNDIYIA